MKRPTKLVVITVVAVAVICVLSTMFYKQTSAAHRHFDEGIGFGKLHMVALEMLDEEAPGVVYGKNGQPYIESFQAFYDYVKAKHPSWVAGIDDPNPFPAVLTEARYGKRTDKATDWENWIFWSETIHPMRSRDMQFRLLANGLDDQ